MKFIRTEADFSAMQAAELTGVSQMMQRDWRRNGHLPPPELGKRVRFSLGDICILALTKAQTDLGKAVSGAMTIARLASYSVIPQIEFCQVGVQFRGIDLTPEEKRELIYQCNASVGGDGTTARYLFVPSRTIPTACLEGTKEESTSTAYFFDSLLQMEERVARDWVFGGIFDLHSLAMSLSLKFASPLITYTLVEDAE